MIRLGDELLKLKVESLKFPLIVAFNYKINTDMEIGWEDEGWMDGLGGICFICVTCYHYGEPWRQGAYSMS